jgi:hypothetical protein
MRADECGWSVAELGLTNFVLSVLESKWASYVHVDNLIMACLSPFSFLPALAQHRHGVHKVAKEYQHTSVWKCGYGLCVNKGAHR